MLCTASSPCSGVKVQALCPGFTRTSLYERPEYASYDVDAAVTRGLWMSPEEVVAASLQGIRA